MMKILVFLLSFLIFYFVFFIKKDQIDLKIKLAVIIGIIGINARIYYYEIKKDIKINKNIISKFNKGEIIKCNNLDVNSDNFIFDEKISSFISKTNKNLIIKFCECK